MPTIIVRCQPLWLPTGKEVDLSPQAYTTLLMTQWLVPIVGEAVNEIDDRSGNPITLAQIWADFDDMSPFAINATDVLFLVRPGEIDGSFTERRARRVQLATLIRDQLNQNLLTENDHLVIPNWNINVTPESSSGFGVKPDGSVAYSW